ncbi:MAG TPA: hypothetical protein VN636_16380 [Acidimicrobiia bacterium]|nr:hypothetical protein [Acidimicrobiia bacterium]
MPEAKEKWDDVGSRFSEIARHIRQRYDANIAFSEDEAKKVDDALRQLGDSLDASFTAIGDSMRDPEIRVELKQAGIAVADAVAATFSDVAEEIKKAVRK